MTYRQLVYMCLDEIKLASDDSYITEEHILFLISKYRAFLLRQKYEKTNMPIAESNYQVITGQPSLDIPSIMTIAKPRVEFTYNVTNPEGIPTPLSSDATFVSSHRFKFVGKPSFLKSIVYCTINKSNRIEFKNLPRINGQEVTPHTISIHAVFEDIVDVSKHNSREILDLPCPIEIDLVSAVQELVVKDALGIAYRPKDILNNANDDLSSLGIASGNPKNNK